MTSAEKIAAAAMLGTQGHKDGLTAPSQDRELMAMIEHNPIGHPENLPVMRAWLTAWTAANINLGDLSL